MGGCADDRHLTARQRADEVKMRGNVPLIF
nr:MAG TPA: hypothetical protein [Caudoviricetes sp.]